MSAYIKGEGANFNEINAHHRDKDLVFNSEEHTYHLVDDPIPLNSVTNLVSDFFPKFDLELWLRRKSERENRSQESILKEWEANGLLARTLGTFMHEQIENAFNSKEVEESFELKCADGSTTTINISTELKYFRHFLTDIRPIPYRTEWKIYDDKHRLAGTLDLLALNHNDEYILYDWKHSKRMGREVGGDFIPNDYNPYQMGLYGLERLSGTPFIVGCLQQNLYRYILENNYGISVQEMYLVMLNTIYNTYHCVPVPRMDKEVDSILSILK